MRVPSNSPGAGGDTAAQAAGPVEPPEFTLAVPFQRTPLMPPAAKRVRALKRHLVAAMRDLREAKRPDRLVQPRTSALEGFAAEVVRAGCALCQGACCRGGGTHAYLDERTMARVRAERPEADARAILRLYTEAVAPLGFVDSCLFHGPAGCTLPQPLRSELCNRYYCNGLHDFLKEKDEPETVCIVARRGAAIGGRVVLSRLPAG
ncbi:MAG: hypothetical protein P4L71_17875 [Acetobacteraceae bacterium]|nr:hypothetical protein [Acetobacteraceae bacterium]